VLIVSPFRLPSSPAGTTAAVGTPVPLGAPVLILVYIESPFPESELLFPELKPLFPEPEPSGPFPDPELGFSPGSPFPFPLLSEAEADLLPLLELLLSLGSFSASCGVFLSAEKFPLMEKGVTTLLGLRVVAGARPIPELVPVTTPSFCTSPLPGML